MGCTNHQNIDRGTQCEIDATTLHTTLTNVTGEEEFHTTLLGKILKIL